MPKVRPSIRTRPDQAKALPIGPSDDGAAGDRSGIPDLEKKLLDQNRELLALLEISQTATKTLETEEILNATLDKSMELFGFDVGYIRTLDKSNKNLIVRVARGLS